MDAGIKVSQAAASIRRAQPTGCMKPTGLMEPTLLKGDHHRMGAVLCPEFLQEGLDMGFDRLQAEKQGFGDFGIAFALA